MTILHTASVVLALWGDHAPVDWWEVDLRALAIVEACGDGPREVPEGTRCLVELAVLWRLESRLRWYPAYRRTGCGPGQVVPTRLWSSRLGEQWTPPCETLRVPRVGLRWAVERLRAKSRFGSWRSRARAYNGSPRADGYAERAVRLAMMFAGLTRKEVPL